MAFHLSRVCVRAPNLISVASLTKMLPRFCSKFDVDVMDEFTSQLMQRKIGKWDQKRRNNGAVMENFQSKQDENQLGEIKIEDLRTDQLSHLFQNLFDNENAQGVIDLMKLCITYNKSPPVSILMNILSICSQHGDKEIVTRIENLCKVKEPQLLVENSHFRHFLAEAIWIKGDVNKALEIFEEVYRENAYLRRRIRLTLKYLISNLVANGSEAALGNMVNFAERIFIDFQDILPLTCVWQACFLSEWFTDQSIALELLETHNGLCKSVINRIPYVVFISLKCHRTEVIYRLLEILLKYKMKQQYSSVLASLLDYQFRWGDLSRCAEIIRWSADNDVALPKKQHIKMINLLLNHKLKTPLVSLEEKEEAKYDYKF